MASKQDGTDARFDVRLGEILKGLGGFMELLGEVGEGKEIRRSGEIRGARDVRGVRDLRGVYGLTIKSGLGGKPVVEQFGNIRPTVDGPAVSDVREPIFDVFDEADHVLVVAELPGIADADIKVEVEGDILTLEANGRDRKYAKELLLPAQVQASSMQRTFANAILEIRLEKAA